MALAGGIGMELALPMNTVPFLFGEDQGRYVLAVPSHEAARLIEEAKAAGVAVSSLGATGGDKIALKGAGEVSLSRLRAAHEGWFPAYMSGEEIPPVN